MDEPEWTLENAMSINHEEHIVNIVSIK